jgi:hypothetical protein
MREGERYGWMSFAHGAVLISECLLHDPSAGGGSSGKNRGSVLIPSCTIAHCAMIGATLCAVPRALGVTCTLVSCVPAVWLRKEACAAAQRAPNAAL